MNEDQQRRFALCDLILFILAVVFVALDQEKRGIVNKDLETYEYTICSVEHHIITPIRQNATVITQESCYFYRHLPNDLYLRIKPEVSPVITAFAAIFSCAFVMLSGLLWFRSSSG